MEESMCIGVEVKSTVATSSSSARVQKMDTSSSSSSSTMMARDTNERESEELLRTAFEELEKERARRIELEEELRALQESSPPSTTSSPPPASTTTTTKNKSERKSKRRSSKSSSVQQDDSLVSTAAVAIPPKNYTALQQELEGYRQIVDAMTQEKPAIAAAIQATSDRRSAVQTGRPIPLQNPTLPLHVIRLLEIMPWEPKAQEHAFGTEEVYEWQVFSARQQKWSSDLYYFPAIFQAVPILRPTSNIVQEYQPTDSLRQPGRDRSLLMFLAGCETMGTGSGTSAALTAPPDRSVLTNARINHMIHLGNGFPLPNDGGTWQWVGGWRIEKRVIVYSACDGMDTRRVTLDCDEEGWSYAMDASHFLKENPEEYCYEHPGTEEDKLTLEKASFLSGNQITRHFLPLRKVRRRKWTRRRVLVDYPYASEQSKNFLRLLAQNASLTVAANKISDQLVETKMKLTDTQLKTHQNEEDTKKKVAQLIQEIKSKEEAIAKLKQQKFPKKVAPCSSNNNSTQQKTSMSKEVAPKETSKNLDTEDCNKNKNAEKTSEVSESKDLETPQKEFLHQGKELQNMISHWVVSSTRQMKVIPNNKVNLAESSDSENPVPEDASDVSSTERPDDDESSLEQVEHNNRDTAPSNNDADDGMNNSASSQKSFDWKKLGRETIEKIKQGQAAAASAPLLWLHASTAKDSQEPQGDHSSITSRPASPSAQSETGVTEPQGGTVSPVSAAPEMTVGA